MIIRSIIIGFAVMFFVLLLYSIMKVSAESSEQEEQTYIPKVEQETKRETEPKVYWPVPLEHELQMFIVQESEKHGIDPSVIFAVIEVESQYSPDAVGDHDQSFGLMQIYQKCHEERIERLRVVDLLDPYQNVVVGIDILSELLERGNGIEWALSYYSGYGGAECDYSRIVMDKAEKIAEGVMVESG